MYAILDVEASGGSPHESRIIEIAIVLHDGKQILERFETLVNPNRKIHWMVKKITGIHEKMLTDAPPFREIADQVRALLSDAIFVAHGVENDYNYIRREFMDIGEQFSSKKLCTMELCKSLFPDIEKYNLDALVKHFDIEIQNRHRAMGDVLATVTLLEKMLQQEQSQLYTHLLINNGIRPEKLPPSIGLDYLHSIEEACGIYYLYNEANELLYIGHTNNLRKGIMAHFGKARRKEGLPGLHRQIHHIHYELTGNAMVAALFHLSEVQQLSPPFNLKERLPIAYYLYMDKNKEEHFQLNISKHRHVVNGKIINQYRHYKSAFYHLRKAAEDYQLLSGITINPRTSRPNPPDLDNVNQYNDRFLKAVEELRENLQGNMFIVDKGRSWDELCVTLIQEGKYVGFGYVEYDQNEPSIHELHEAISYRMEHTDEAARIINRYLEKSKTSQVIYW